MSESTTGAAAGTTAVKTVTDHVPCWPNFFQGRVLTAEVFRDYREAVLGHLRRLGSAIGPGVVDGFIVEGEGSSTLSVTAGVAINRKGETLHLQANADIAVPTATDAVSSRAAFATCRRGGGEVDVAASVYLLTVRPHEGYRDKEPRFADGVGASGVLGCGWRCLAEGMVFELLELPADAPCDPTDTRFRNLLAFWCFYGDGLWSGDLRRWREGVESVPALTAAHVPLAALAWDGTAVTVLDMWAARRDPATPSADDAWSGLVGAGAARLGRARLLSFQAQLGHLLETVETPSRIDDDYLRFYPPAFLFPVTVVGEGASLQPLGSVSSVATREEARLALERSFLADPVDAEVRELNLDAYLIAPGEWGGPFCRGEGVEEEARADMDALSEGNVAALEALADDQGRVWVLFVRRVRDLFTAPGGEIE